MAFPAVLCLALVGCASGPAHPAPNLIDGSITVPVPEVRPVPPRKVSRVVLPRRTEESRYSIESVARVERDSSGNRESAEIRTTALISLTVERDSLQTRGNGVVDSFVVRGLETTGGVTSASMQPLRVPFEFAIDSNQMRVAVVPALANVCDQPETGATTLVRDLVMRLPRDLVVGATWTDSSAAFVCRAGVPIIIRTKNSYFVDRIDGTEEQNEVFVTRTMETMVEGSSTVAWRARSVRGSGGGTQTIRLNGKTGAIVELDGKTSLTLDVGPDRVTQQVQLTVRAL